MEAALGLWFPHELAALVREYALWCFEDLQSVFRPLVFSDGGEWSADQCDCGAGCHGTNYRGIAGAWRIKLAAGASSSVVCEWALALREIAAPGWIRSVDFGWTDSSFHRLADQEHFLEGLDGAVALTAEVIQAPCGRVLVHCRLRVTSGGVDLCASTPLLLGDELWSRYEGDAGQVTFAIRRAGVPLALDRVVGAGWYSPENRTVTVPVTRGSTLTPAFALSSRPTCRTGRFAVRPCG
jgi:hypothetical protein